MQISQNNLVLKCINLCEKLSDSREASPFNMGKKMALSFPTPLLLPSDHESPSLTGTLSISRLYKLMKYLRRYRMKMGMKFPGR